ncbi:MAG: hypothetical protein NTX50_03300 [Candidatus Sumerlaeota bacterium]|nr:hypothetical protein [Candidatus Sumerlaeota bacterium]
MALRLSDYILRGELFNTERYSTHGVLKLRGAESWMALDFTGDCDPDLRGKHIRFTARPGRAVKRIPKDFEKGLNFHQIGPTGQITAALWLRGIPCSVEEFLRRAHAGEAPPTKWTRCLQIEWFGQHGRGIIQLMDPRIMECVREGNHKDNDDGDWRPLPMDVPMPNFDPDTPPDQLDEDGQAGISGTVFHRTDDGVTAIDFSMRRRKKKSGERGDKKEEHSSGEDAPSDGGDNESGEESEGGIPRDLQRQLDAEAAAVNYRVQGWDDDTVEVIKEMELMDDLIDHGEPERLWSFLEHPDKLPPPDSLDDAKVESQLKCLLAELAMGGVAFHVCQHFTPRDAYRLLVERILRQEGAFSQLRGTGWTQNFMTSEFCPACDAEAEERYKSYEAEKNENEDSCPF